MPQKICLTSPLMGLPHLMRQMVLHKWTWKAGVILTELPSFPLQVQFLGGKVFLSGYITPAVLGVPHCSERGGLSEVAQWWAKWLHNPFCLWGPQLFKAGKEI